MQTFVVRVWLPDRPGALGQVATRIGAAGADVVGIEILERGGGNAIDELTVAVGDPSMIDQLVAEIGQVDGVAVEDVRAVAAGRPDHGTVALELAAELVHTDPGDLAAALCAGVCDLVDGDWAVTVSVVGDVTAAVGSPPESAWVAAFVEGSRHLSAVHESTPGDIAWAHLPRRATTVVAGRSGRVFHARERQQVHLVGRIVDAM